MLGDHIGEGIAGRGVRRLAQPGAAIRPAIQPDGQGVLPRGPRRIMHRRAERLLRQQQRREAWHHVSRIQGQRAIEHRAGDRLGAPSARVLLAEARHDVHAQRARGGLNRQRRVPAVHVAAVPGGPRSLVLIRGTDIVGEIRSAARDRHVVVVTDASAVRTFERAGACGHRQMWSRGETASLGENLHHAVDRLRAV